MAKYANVDDEDEEKMAGSPTFADKRPNLLTNNSTGTDEQKESLNYNQTHYVLYDSPAKPTTTTTTHQMIKLAVPGQTANDYSSSNLPGSSFRTKFEKYNAIDCAVNEDSSS